MVGTQLASTLAMLYAIIRILIAVLFGGFGLARRVAFGQAIRMGMRRRPRRRTKRAWVLY